MSLFGALETGRTALAVQQAALQVTGNNIANAGNADYSRETANLTPAQGQQIRPGVFIGEGVDLSSIQRQVDEALQERLRGSTSDNSAADANQQWLGRVESTFNELSDNDLSTQLSTFFKGWSSLANKPADAGARQVVLQNGQSLSDWMKNLSGQLGSLQGNVDDQLASQTKNASDLAQKVADLNGQIAVAEAGQGGANGLRDQRDAALTQLSQQVGIKTLEQPDGEVNVYIGSEPLVDGTNNHGLALVKEADATGALVPKVIFKNNNGTAPITTGQIGGLLSVRGQITGTIGQVNDIAHNLIFELNKIHASGQGTQGFSSVTGTNQVTDATKALNDPAAGLAFTPNNGSFVVHVTDKTTGLSTSTLVQVDLDGQNNNDTTLNSLQTTLAGITGVKASIAGGKLTIAAGSANQEISFSQDSSGTLAALGINTFFTGKNTGDIAVNSTLTTQPNLLAAAKNGDKADNQTALAISNLESTPLTGLGNQSLKDSYETIVNDLGSSAAAAKSNSTAAQTVQDTLQAQKSALSGVSMDEEAVNMIQQQRAFQAASRVVSAVDDMMKTLLAIT